jgi:hypothetical protein
MISIIWILEKEGDGAGKAFLIEKVFLDKWEEITSWENSTII